MAYCVECGKRLEDNYLQKESRHHPLTRTQLLHCRGIRQRRRSKSCTPPGDAAANSSFSGDMPVEKGVACSFLPLINTGLWVYTTALYCLDAGAGFSSPVKPFCFSAQSAASGMAEACTPALQALNWRAITAPRPLRFSCLCFSDKPTSRSNTWLRRPNPHR